MTIDDYDALEDLVDRYTLAEVLEALGVICELKADHVLTNWQDAGLAKSWEVMAKRIDKVSCPDV